jgi:MSHA biogenesis protein MshM
LFDWRALIVLFFASGGVPRLINLLAHKSLWSAYGRNQLRVGWQDVRTAVEDTPEARSTARWLLGGNRVKYWLTYGLVAASGALVHWLGY